MVTAVFESAEGCIKVARASQGCRSPLRYRKQPLVACFTCQFKVTNIIFSFMCKIGIFFCVLYIVKVKK